MKTACSEARIVSFTGGFSADWEVVARLLDLEDRGACFRLEQGNRFRVIPPSVLTPDDVAFLRARRDEARAVIAYSQLIGNGPTN